MFYPRLDGGLLNLSVSLEDGQAWADTREAQTGVELMQHGIDRLLMIGVDSKWKTPGKEFCPVAKPFVDS